MRVEAEAASPEVVDDDAETRDSGRRLLLLLLVIVVGAGGGKLPSYLPRYTQQPDSPYSPPSGGSPVPPERGPLTGRGLAPPTQTGPSAPQAQQLGERSARRRRQDAADFVKIKN
ncbi:unnamed protein product [Lampetra fluviatilis]